ncbi:hypothetical protein HKD37_U058576 [Glycine soja]
MLYLECDPILKAVENEDDLDDVPVAGHEEDVGAGEHVGAGEQRDADADGGEHRDTDAGEQRDGSEQRDADAGGEERDVADSEEEKEVDSDEWFINFSCMMNEVEAKVETDGEMLAAQLAQASRIASSKSNSLLEESSGGPKWAWDLFQLYRKSCLVHLIDSVSCIFGKILQSNEKARNLKELCGNVQNPLLLLSLKAIWPI